MSVPRVAIIGAGLGGLTLAQSLRRAGLEPQVFERDRGPFDRPQGYRLHLDFDAINAAREVLPPALYSLFEATSHWTESCTTILRTDLSVVKRLPIEDDHGIDVWPAHQGPAEHANVDRATLRQILLNGLADCLHFDKALDHYDTTAGKVVAHFVDGTTVEADVLVGADGVHSAVRRQRAPHCDTVDSGITAIYGRVDADAAKRFVPDETLSDIFTIASDERKVFLGMGAVCFRRRHDVDVQSLLQGTPTGAQRDYVVSIVGGRHEYFPTNLRALSGADLQRIAAETIGCWPDPARALVRAGDAATFFPIAMFTSVPCELGAPTNVTLLGDAIHAMTPTLGRGANVAMRDGALLGRVLADVARGDQDLVEALRTYERQMLDYGFAVVREAALIGMQRMGQNPLPR